MGKVILRIVGMVCWAAAIGAGATRAQSATPAKHNCSDAEYHQLDFWIGDWTVFKTADNAKNATSRIVPVMDGCGIQENYASPKASGGAYYGTSYSSFDHNDGRWHQMYIDINGNVTWFSGGLVGKAIELTAPGPKGSIQKMVYKPLPDGSVEQIGTVSTDGGKTWQPGYDYTYRKSRKGAGRV